MIKLTRRPWVLSWSAFLGMGQARASQTWRSASMPTVFWAPLQWYRGRWQSLVGAPLWVGGTPDLIRRRQPLQIVPSVIRDDEAWP